jgi:glycosyltransferase involved in cell wall biosynthesis
VGALIEQENIDPRVKVLRNPKNMGVGGAVQTGYRAALADDMDVVVKIDGDGQMPPSLLPLLVAPIIAGEADYVKGNRFFSIEDVKTMPAVRIIGNAGLSFLTKLSTGYWSLFDPTNGYTAIHAAVLARLPLDRIAERYFFESDMLFRLNVLRARVVDMPMAAVYRDEKSNMRISRVVLPFLRGHLRNLGTRILYNYFLRDFQIASLELVLGLTAILFGASFGAWLWLINAERSVNTPAGPVMLAALPILTGMQLLLAFIGFDIRAEPTRAIHPSLPRVPRRLPPSAYRQTEERR